MKTFRSKPKFIAKPPARVQSMAKKYGTLEIAKKDEPYGTNVITNGTFDTDTDWIKDANWTISGGTATSDGGSGDLDQSIPTIEVGKTYEVTFTLSGLTTGRIYAYLGQWTTDAGSGGTNDTFTFRAVMGEYTNLAIRFYSDVCDASVDNVILRKVNI